MATITGTTGNDTLTGTAANDTINGGDGADSILGLDGSDLLNGEAGNDTLDGGSGNDTIYGGIGNDNIVGRTGNDLLYGGLGNNSFSIDDTHDQDSIFGGVDWDDLYFSSSSSSAGVYVHFTTSGGGTYDFYGTSAQGTFAEINLITGTDYNDLFDASLDASGTMLATHGGNDTIYGGSGSDTIYGGAGNDLIFGNAGNDAIKIEAGSGTDTLYGGAGTGDILAFDAMGGADAVTFTFTGLVSGSYNFGLTGGSGTFSEFEIFSGTSNVDTLNLTAAPSTYPLSITYTGATTSVVSDGSTSITATEIERYLFGAGNDTFAGALATGALIVDGGAGADSIAGGLGNDALTGGVGNDTLFGAAGNDTLSGGDGDDLLLVSSGNDSMVGGLGYDILDATLITTETFSVNFSGIEEIRGSNSGDSWNWTSDAIKFYGGIGADTVTAGSGNDTLIAGDGDDLLYGGGGNDSFSGGAGNDTFSGGVGADSFDGGTGLDVLDYATSGAAVFVDLETGALSGGDAAGDVIVSGIDGVIGSSFNDTLSGANGQSTSPSDTYSSFIDGGAGDDLIDGRAGDDTLLGGAGNDSLNGGTGNDSLFGGDDSDTFTIGDSDGTDTIVGGEGGTDSDVLTFVGTQGVSLLFSGNEAGTYASADGSSGQFAEIEGILGGSGSDTIDARGASTSVTLSGGDGADVIVGGSAADSLYGGLGDDRLTGGSGADILSGGTGSDVFVMSASGGADTIVDFDLTDLSGAATDQLDVSALANASGDPIGFRDVVVTDTNGDGTGDAILTFPDGTSVTLVGVQVSQVDSKAELAAIGIPCFASGTPLQTERGWTLVEELRAGDRVLCDDGTTALVIWSGGRKIGKAEMQARPGLRPIRIASGVLGNEGGLIVSPQHAFSMLLAGQERVLVRAVHLARHWHGGVRTAKGIDQICYHHVLLDRHAVVNAAGAPAESMYPGPAAMNGLTPVARVGVIQAVLQAKSGPILPGVTLASLPEIYGPRVQRLLGDREVCMALGAGRLTPVAFASATERDVA